MNNLFKKATFFGTALLGILFLLACGEAPRKPEIAMPRTDLGTEPLIPKPVVVQPNHLAFGLNGNSGIFIPAGSTDFDRVGLFLAEKIAEKTGLQLPVNPGNPEKDSPAIYLVQNALLGGEAYTLSIGPDSVRLAAGTAEGAFRGVQTLRQLIPETPNDTLAAYPIWPIAGGTISDHPRFAYRGAMLDVARHFFTVKEVKKYLEVLAYYKINVLHLHLTDDQGWRIEIRSWPKLAEIGGLTEVGGGAGGYYTQEQYRDLVAFAAERFITIVPEVDMPGHTNAAYVAYPILNGTGKTPGPYTGTQVGFSTLDTRKDTVYQFIEDVVREISAMTPGPYFHIGGDESHSTKPGDYRNFIERVVPLVRKYGKIPLGWDEVATATLDSNVVAQFWDNEQNASKAIAQGMKILMSPARKAYLDMQYDSLSKHGLHWAAYIPVDSAYTWDPATYARGIGESDILGIEAPLWSETISNSAELEYLAFPRLPGYAELGWSFPDGRSWEEYRKRLARQLPYFQRMDVRFYPSKRVPWGVADSLLPWYSPGPH